MILAVDKKKTKTKKTKTKKTRELKLDEVLKALIEQTSELKNIVILLFLQYT